MGTLSIKQTTLGVRYRKRGEHQKKTVLMTITEKGINVHPDKRVVINH